jgi:malate synthase
VFVATCHEALAEIGAQPTLYLPKMESRHETEWWAKIFAAFAEMLGIDPLTIRSTTMIEVRSPGLGHAPPSLRLLSGPTSAVYAYVFGYCWLSSNGLLAGSLLGWLRCSGVFVCVQSITAIMENDEMNYTLRQHSLGQNKGRYDYLFNFIKRLTLPKSQQVALLRKALQSPAEAPQLLSAYRQFLLPDNAYTIMGTSFLDAFSNHTSQVNLQRGFDSVSRVPHRSLTHPPPPPRPSAFLMGHPLRAVSQVGGMVTNIPTGDPEVDGRAKAKLRVDKTNEAWKGDAGGWSGHPAFSAAVREPFDIVRGVHKGSRSWRRARAAPRWRRPSGLCGCRRSTGARTASSAPPSRPIWPWPGR